MKAPFDHGYDLGLAEGLCGKPKAPVIAPIGLLTTTKAEQDFQNGLALGHARGLDMHRMTEARILRDLERSGLENSRE